MIRTNLVMIGILFLLTGCWSSQELDNVALVHGVGVDKSDDQLNISVEIIKPTNGQQNGETDGQENGQHIVLKQNADTLLEGARGLIRDAKRRLEFGHARAWIVSERLAKEENFVHVLDSVRRDQMLRLNSHLFITQEDPSEILNTPTLYEDLSSIELVSALEHTEFNTDYVPTTLREFYKLIEGPVSNAYIPMILVEKKEEQTITSINGTAVIKQNKWWEILTPKKQWG